jgi:signal transduction histidine kinase
MTKDEMLVVFYEIPGSRLECRFPFLESLLSLPHKGIAVYSAPDRILVKANNQYLSYLDEPYNIIDNCIGKRINEIASGWESSSQDIIWKKVEETCNPACLKESAFGGFKRGVTYWDSDFIPLMDGNKVKYIVVIAVDVTERVMARKEMESRINDIEEKLHIKDDVFYYLSHEFKTPITLVNAAVQTMEHICGDEIPYKVKKYMRQIKQNSLRQLRLVNNILDITRAESGYMKLHRRNMDIVSVTKAITESVSLYAKEKGEKLVFKSSLSKKVMAIDDEKYERILLNLLSNAIKFSSEGQTIKVIVSEKNNMVYIQVADNGIGIPEQKQKIIFERFGQVSSGLAKNQEGTGIGLYLVKLLVDALGGEVTVESNKGKGSIFTIILPDTTVSDQEETQDRAGNIYEKLVPAIALEFSDIYLTSTDE